MATLRQAVERLRENHKLPRNVMISVGDLHRTFRPSPLGSTRALMRTMFDGVTQKLPWAVILCRFKGERADPAREAPVEQLYRGMFAPGTGGLVEYWRDVSLGAIDIVGSQVFGWIELDVARAN